MPELSTDSSLDIGDSCDFFTACPSRANLDLLNVKERIVCLVSLSDDAGLLRLSTEARLFEVLAGIRLSRPEFTSIHPRGKKRVGE